MALEIERKFLVRDEVFKTEAYGAVRIQQGYLCATGGRTVRIRIRDEQGYITIKGRSSIGGLARYEWEKEIPIDEARELLALCEPGIIDKTRYLVKNGELTFEVDEFYGDNEGLLMAEIELPTENTPFDKPAWLGQEVTGDIRYYNAQLRKHPYKSW